ncbi:MAG: alpha/beta fold hydrolase, partial [Thermomicrobiales bacterium]|nr:alpha/beta fold hydrolase [Thermomicrobiales bacterium]
MNVQPDRIVERWTDVAGLPIFSRTAEIQPRNPTPPVLLIHGLSVSSRPFLPTLRALAPDVPGHALDLPGVGRSAKPRRPLDIPALANASADWMHATAIDRAVLVGHSMGAQVAVELAHRHPDRVLGVVLVSPTGDPNAGGIGRQILRLCRDGLREP